MEIASLVLSIVSITVAAASAWIAWRVARPKPKLIVRLTTIIHGHIDAVFDGDVPLKSTVALAHYQVTNLSTHPVQLMDYKLSVAMKDGETHSFDSYRSATLNFTVDWAGEERWDLNFTPSTLASWPLRAVRYGELEMGFLPFFFEAPLNIDHMRSYHLMLRDVFGNQYEADITMTEISKWWEGDTTLGLGHILEHSGVEYTVHATPHTALAKVELAPTKEGS